MWNRKQLKKNARKNIKNNYSKVVAVCFIIAILTSSYKSSTVIINSYDETKETTNQIQNKIEKNDNTKIIEKILNKEKVSKTNKQIEKLIGNTLKEDTYLFKIVYSIQKFITKRISTGIILILSGILSFLVLIFFQNILLVGESSFFLKISNKRNTKISDILYLFKMDTYKQTLITMLKKYMYLVLWAFTILMLPIKFYEYKMVTYIIATNPSLKSGDVFKLSKELMYGNKWKAFVLDLSFIGWEILTVLTFGLAGILYVNPYRKSTETELYKYLANNFIQ